MATEIARRRFTVEEYYRMAHAGILRRDDRVELIDGQVVQMSPIGSGHAAAVAALTRGLQILVGDRAVLWVQSPLRLGPHDVPQPDVALLHPPLDQYRGRFPEPGDMRLVVEVSDASLDYDRSVKLPLYARAGLPEAWVVDLAGAAIELHRAPVRGHYRLAERVVRGGTMSPVAFPDARLEATDILGIP